MVDSATDNAARSMVEAVKTLTDNVATIAINVSSLTQRNDLWTPATIISIIAVVVAIFSWIAAYIYGMRIQKKRFYFEMVNKARQDIAQSIDEYQNWLMQLSIAIEGIEKNLPYISLSKTTLRDWYFKLKSREYDPLKWYYVIEEYKRIFPEVYKLGKEMQEKYYNDVVFFSVMLGLIFEPPNFILPEQFNDSKKYVEENHSRIKSIVDRQVYNLQQLKIYVHESYFCAVFGKKKEYQIGSSKVGIASKEEAGREKFSVIYGD